MKLSKAYSTFSAILLLALGANAIVMTNVKKAYDSVVFTQEHRQQAMALTNELRQETSQLTRFVRSYANTAESRYLLYYYDILAIRKGEKSAPIGYSDRSYWDRVVAGRIQHKLPNGGLVRSLEDRMKSLNYSALELAGLKKVLAATEALGHIEQIAFASTQGLYDPIKGDFVSDGKPQLEFASKLVLGKEYNLLKADQSEAVENLSSLVEHRTNEEVLSATKLLERLILESLAFMSGTFVLVILSYLLIRKQVLKPIGQLSNAANRLAVGEYFTRTGTIRGVDELVVLGNTLDAMAQSIEQDIAARVNAQKEIETARQHAEESTRSKSMFLANMSHEIRTPMNAIIGMSYLALKTELSPRQYDYINNVHDAAKSLLGIINDILDFSKVEARKIELEESSFRLEDVINNSISLVRQRAQEKEIELLFAVDDLQLLGKSLLLGDPLRLGQILNNLLTNAVKFTHDGYVKLTVNIENRDENQATLRFEIRDSGIGMTPEQIAQLFREFTQADGSTTRKYGGTGLGLSIAKSLVELMGGRIWAESVLNEGSCFTFVIHLKISRVLPQPVDLSGIEKLRVLVIDDQLEARETLTSLLALFGVGLEQNQGIESANNGATARTLIRKAIETGHPYDLLLVDWVMPDIDGGTLLKELKEAGEVYPPQVVIVSAYDSDVVHEAAAKVGVNLFLPKPVLPDGLRSLLNTVTGNRIEKNDSSFDVGDTNNLTGMQVLLVEDNAINRQLAVELLRSQGIQIEVAHHGQEAIEKLLAVAADHYHAVLMDLQMPVMDGYEATRRLRADPRYINLPIIAMSAHAMPEEHQRTHELGMNSHIDKPIEPDILYATLGQFFNAPAAPVQHNQILAPISQSQMKTPPPVIVGLDTIAGMRRSAGKPDLYRQMLSSFTNDFANFGSDLTAMLEQELWGDAERHAHTLKGLAGTIGATALQATVKNLETACKSRLRLDANTALEKVQQNLLPLVNVLQQYLPSQFPETVPIAQTPVVQHEPFLHLKLLRLRLLLNEGDSDAIELWQNNASDFSKMLTPQIWLRVATAIKNYEFTKALALLPEQSNDQHE